LYLHSNIYNATGARFVVASASATFFQSITQGLNMMKFTRTKALLMAFPFFTQQALAAGGLNKATKAVMDINSWLYVFLGVICISVLIYHIIMALMQKESWNEVLMAVGKVCVAGGVLGFANWAWSMFGA